MRKPLFVLPGARRRHSPAGVPAPAAGHFAVQAARGRFLGADAAGRVEMTDAPGLLLVLPERAPQTCFLLAPDGRRIGVEGDGFTGPAISARLRRVPGRKVELRHPLAHVRYLGAVFTAAGERPERVMFDRTGHKEFDRFELVPADGLVLTEAGRALAAEVALAAAPPMSAEGVLTLLGQGRVRLALAEAVLRVLPPDELQSLADRLVRDPAALALLRKGMPGDEWLDDRLPALLAWCARGRPATRRLTSPASEEAQASLIQSGALRPQLGLAVTALARRTIAPRRIAAVLATARNEGPYLLEWLAHHRAIGFEHAVIYSNDNDDGSGELLGRLADAGEITWVHNEPAPDTRPQWKACGHAFKMLPDLLDYRWTMVLDIDEFVGFRTDMFGSIADFIGWQEHQPVDAFALRWLNYFAAPDDVWHDAPSTRRFLRRDAGVSPLFKSLVRSNQFWDSHCHFPFSTLGRPFAYALEDGGVCHHMGLVRGEKMPPDPVTAELAWVSHYTYRSAAEALIKVARGYALWRTDSPAAAERRDEVVQRFVGMAARPDLVEDQRTLLCAPRLDAELARLLAILGVAASDRAIKQRHAGRLRVTADEFLQAGWGPERPAYAALAKMLAVQREAADANDLFTVGT